MANKLLPKVLYSPIYIDDSTSKVVPIHHKIKLDSTDNSGYIYIDKGATGEWVKIFDISQTNLNTENISANADNYTSLAADVEGIKVNITSLEESIKNIKPFTIKKLSELPEIGEPNILYLISSKDTKPGEETNIFEEYLWIDNKWEKVGATSINLDEELVAYAKIEYVDTITNSLSDRIDNIDTTIPTLVTKTELTSEINKVKSDLQESINDSAKSAEENSKSYTDSEITKLNINSYAKIEDVEDDLNNLKTTLQTQISDKVSQSEFDSTVIDLRDYISEAKSDALTAEENSKAYTDTKVSTINSQITNLTTLVNNNETDIEDKVSKLTVRVKSNEDNIKNINTTISNLDKTYVKDEELNTVKDNLTASINTKVSTTDFNTTVDNLNSDIQSALTDAESALSKSEANTKSINTINTTISTLATKTDLDSKVDKSTYNSNISGINEGLQNIAYVANNAASATVTNANNITTLEGKVNTNTSSISTINNTISTLATKTELQTNIDKKVDKTTYTSDLANLNSDIESNTTNITKNSNAITNLSNSLDNIASKITVSNITGEYITEESNTLENVYTSSDKANIPGRIVIQPKLSNSGIIYVGENLQNIPYGAAFPLYPDQIGSFYFSDINNFQIRSDIAEDGINYHIEWGVTNTLDESASKRYPLKTLTNSFITATNDLTPFINDQAYEGLYAKITLQANINNVGALRFGEDISDISAGFPLYAGQFITLECNDITKFLVSADITGDSFNYIANITYVDNGNINSQILLPIYNKVTNADGSISYNKISTETKSIRCIKETNPSTGEVSYKLDLI